jgi:hypothetical protein
MRHANNPTLKGAFQHDTYINYKSVMFFPGGIELDRVIEEYITAHFSGLDLELNEIHLVSIEYQDKSGSVDRYMLEEDQIALIEQRGLEAAWERLADIKSRYFYQCGARLEHVGRD